MSCEAFKDDLVGRLYGDLEPENDARLAAHLGVCDGCARDLEDLAQARRMLRDAEPAVPWTPRVVILGERAGRTPLLAIAAGLAGIGILTGIALSWSWQARGVAAELLRSSGSASSVPASGPTREQVESWVDARWARLEAERGVGGELRAVPASPSPGGGERPMTKAEVQTLLTHMEDRIDRSRDADFRYLLDEIGGIEARTGQSLVRTQEALRYLALASDPQISEQ